MTQPLNFEAAYMALKYGLANSVGMSPQEGDDTLLRRAREDHVDAARYRQAVIVFPRETRRRLRAKAVTK